MLDFDKFLRTSTEIVLNKLKDEVPYFDSLRF